MQQVRPAYSFSRLRSWLFIACRNGLVVFAKGALLWLLQPPHSPLRRMRVVRAVGLQKQEAPLLQGVWGPLEGPGICRCPLITLDQ